MFIPFFLFSIGVMSAITICAVWSKFGGDEGFEKIHPNFRTFLHTLHHWMFGLFLVSICPLFIMLSPITIPVYTILGMGLGSFIDDVIFHSYEYYFQRKHNCV